MVCDVFALADGAKCFEVCCDPFAELGHIPSSPRLRSASNAADARFVKDLTKRRRFQRGSSWNMAWFRCFAG